MDGHSQGKGRNSATDRNRRFPVSVPKGGHRGFCVNPGMSEADILKQGAEYVIGRPLDEQVKSRGGGEEIGFEEVAVLKGAECLLGRPVEVNRRGTRDSSDITEADIVKTGAEWLIGRPLEDRKYRNVSVDDFGEIADLVKTGTELILGRPLEGGSRSYSGSSEVDVLMKGAEFLLGRPLDGSSSYGQSRGVSEAELLTMGTEWILRTTNRILENRRGDDDESSSSSDDDSSSSGSSSGVWDGQRHYRTRTVRFVRK